MLISLWLNMGRQTPFSSITWFCISKFQNFYIFSLLLVLSCYGYGVSLDCICMPVQFPFFHVVSV